jgi:protein-S-isoprenylcysteine O-methyltransferase Ste14
MGLALTWWARIHLGCLWSSAITRKEKHRIVETGPYAFVRHPIYTGLISALLATAATEATPVALLGALLITLGLWVKARIEEHFLLSELGPEAYECYRYRVPMLVPFRATLIFADFLTSGYGFAGAQIICPHCLPCHQ